MKFGKFFGKINENPRKYLEKFNDRKTLESNKYRQNDEKNSIKF